MTDTNSSRSGKHLYAEIRNSVDPEDWGSTPATRAAVLDELIAGDADLYDANTWYSQAQLDEIKRFARHDRDCSSRKGIYKDAACDCGFEAASAPIASARIKGDKDRENPVERPQPLEIADDLSNSTYAAFMAERGDHLRMLTDLAHQYLSDLRYPPTGDSRDRRIERIEAVLKEVQPWGPIYLAIQNRLTPAGVRG